MSSLRCSIGPLPSFNRNQRHEHLQLLVGRFVMNVVQGEMFRLHSTDVYSNSTCLAACRTELKLFGELW